MGSPVSEGNLKAPIRHPLDWQNPEFYNEAALQKEMERVFDICHGCRRCVSLCQSFPSLFDLVDSSELMEVDGVRKEDYDKVVEHCLSWLPPISAPLGAKGDVLVCVHVPL